MAVPSLSERYAQAGATRGATIGDLALDKYVSGESGYFGSYGGAIKDKTKAKLTGIKETFDPLNIVKGLTGSKMLTAAAGKALGRSDEDIGYFTGKAVNKKKKDEEESSEKKEITKLQKKVLEKENKFYDLVFNRKTLLYDPQVRLPLKTLMDKLDDIYELVKAGDDKAKLENANRKKSDKEKNRIKDADAADAAEAAMGAEGATAAEAVAAEAGGAMMMEGLVAFLPEILLGIAAITAAIAAAVALYVYWDDIMEYIDETIQSVKDWYDGVVKTIDDTIKAAQDWYNGVVQGITDTIQGAIDTVSNTITNIIQSVEDVADGIKQSIVDSINYVEEGIGKIVGSITDGINEAINSVYDGIKNIVTKVANFLAHPLDSAAAALGFGDEDQGTQMSSGRSVDTKTNQYGGLETKTQDATAQTKTLGGSTLAANVLAQPGEKTDTIMGSVMDESDNGPLGGQHSATKDFLGTRTSSGSIFKADKYEIYDENGQKVEVPKDIFMKMKDAAANGNAEGAFKIYEDWKKAEAGPKQATVGSAISDAVSDLFGSKPVPTTENKMNTLDQSRAQAGTAQNSAPIIVNAGGGQAPPPPPPQPAPSISMGSATTQGSSNRWEDKMLGHNADYMP